MTKFTDIISKDKVSGFETTAKRDIAYEKRIKELEEAALELFNLIHASDLVEKISRANELYDVIKLKIKI